VNVFSGRFNALAENVLTVPFPMNVSFCNVVVPVLCLGVMDLLFSTITGNCVLSCGQNTDICQHQNIGGQIVVARLQQQDVATGGSIYGCFQCACARGNNGGGCQADATSQ
jgi:hypothetical protein